MDATVTGLTSYRQTHTLAVLNETAAICRSALSLSTTQSLLHAHGMLLARQGQIEVGIAFLKRAAVLNPANDVCLLDLGDLLARTARVDEAEHVYCRALAFDSERPGIYRRLGRALAQKGLLKEATVLYEHAIRIAPAHAETYGELGDILQEHGRHIDALRYYERAVQLDPQGVQACVRLGRGHIRLNDANRAIETFRDGLKRHRQNADLYMNLGLALLSVGSVKDAYDAFDAAAGIAPYDVAACRQLTCTLELLERREEAASAWCRLGAALERQERFKEAAVAYRETLARKPRTLRALMGMAAVHLHFREHAEARLLLEQVLAIEPEHMAARLGLGWAASLGGDYPYGWAQLEWFDRYGPGEKRYFEQPLWDGTCLEGQTILLWETAGLGDAIQRIRYAALLKRRGGRVILQCDRPLLPLFARVPSIDRVLARHTALPGFDTHAPLSALPRLLQERRCVIHADVPYLRTDTALVEKWRRRLDARPDEKRIGLVWGGEPARLDRHIRFAHLGAFAALARVPSLRLISLQLGQAALEILAPPRGLRVEQVLDESYALTDTAALIQNLDLVVTVDTMVAHLAGALAKPVWLVLAYAAECRWLTGTDTSPWYPTMRLFRQSRQGDWAGTVAQVAALLAHGD